jgi:hypothetical protein
MEPGGPTSVPTALNAWRNFADRWDPVALDQTLRDEFDPPKNFARDGEVNNDDLHDHMSRFSRGDRGPDERGDRRSGRRAILTHVIWAR